MKQLFRFLGRWRASLGTKFVVLTVAVLAVTLTATSILNYSSQRDLLHQHLRAKGETLGNFVALIAPEAIHNFDLVLLDDYMREVTRIEDVIYGVVVDRQGRNVTSYLDFSNKYIARGAREVGNHDVLKIVTAVNAFDGVVPLRFPIMVANEPIGTVMFGVNTERTELNARYEMIKWTLGNLIVIGFLSLCIYLVFRYHTLLPMQELIAGAERVATGELDKRVNVKSYDELGTLAQSFNHMMQSLDSSTREKDAVLAQLKDMNRTLEERVSERTVELATANKELEHLALHDTLSGLPNRALLMDRLEQAIINAMRTDSQFAIMVLDLDRFKEINDTLGHNVGDLLLKEVAKRLVSVLRDTDTVARLGGDEFAVVLSGAGTMEATRIATKLLQFLERPMLLENHSFAIGGSIGIAVYPEHGDSASLLLQRGDVAMYIAKRNNSGYMVYKAEEDRHSPSRLAFMSEFRGAIDRGELALFYQPKVHLATGHVRAVEALLRWNHPRDGIILPGDYIPMSEQTGLIRPLTTWVVGEAMRQVAEWHRAGRDVAVSINLSMRNLHDPQLPGIVSALLRNWRVDPQAVVFEITESAVMADPEHTIEVLKRLHAMGVALSIDDFGTGYSSLSYLKRMPVSELKIDKSFVMDMGTDEDDAIIVRSTIDLAHNLGLKVTGEGVQDEDAFTVLVSLGCDLAQGHYISPALPAEALEQWLRESVWGVGNALAGGRRHPIN